MQKGKNKTKKELKFQFIGGVSPLTMRARCSNHRYIPDPLGIVTAVKTMDYERSFVTGHNQDA